MENKREMENSVMSNKKLPIITINREYGALGHTIAKALSERLDIPFYDKDFITKTAVESGFSKEDIQKASEDISSGARILENFLGGATSIYKSPYDEIFDAQCRVMMELAKTPCIMVGRCCNAVLVENSIPCFNVFLYADFKHRKTRVAELPESQGKELDRYIQRRDAQRHNYYKRYTGRDFCDAREYNLCLDTGKLSIDTCVDLIISAMESTIRNR